jgi:hypothetical protein
MPADKIDRSGKISRLHGGRHGAGGDATVFH